MLVALERLTRGPGAAAVAALVPRAVGARGDKVLGVDVGGRQQRALVVGCGVDLHPRLAAVLGAQDHGIVADGDAVFRVCEAHVGERGGGRRARGAPAAPLVVGEQHYAALAHAHGAVAGGRQAQYEQPVGGDLGRRERG